MLEKTEKFISNKTSHKFGKIKIEKTSTETRNIKYFNSRENIVPSIKILNISSDIGSETQTEETIFAYNKIFLPRITEIRSLGKNKVKFVTSCDLFLLI